MFMGRPLVRPRPIDVEVAPPPVRHVAPPPRPSPAHVWIDGYWGWENGAHVWVAGAWALPPLAGYVWVPARWKRHGHRWEYYPGHWKHHHGPVYIEAESLPPGALPANDGITISGHVTDLQGAPVPGVVVKLSGAREGEVLIDDSGAYRFSDLPPGSYSIRPTGGGCAFAPDVANLSNLGGSVVQDIIVSGCPGW
jgi:hypothetical protein